MKHKTEEIKNEQQRHPPFINDKNIKTNNYKNEKSDFAGADKNGLSPCLPAGRQTPPLKWGL
jgi:hypothetical protein